MKAVGIPANGSSQSGLVDLELDEPLPKARDLLVKVEAVSVNPLDVKMSRAKPQPDGRPRILGWDAAGVVLGAGSDVTLFKPGDRVYYAGSITRPGANAERHIVDERIVGKMPASLSFAQAAALPVSALTAWEAIFDRMRISSGGQNGQATILIIGAAGGVGSMAIQVAKTVAGLKVAATASRPESQQWCRSLGADLVIDHRADLKSQLSAAGIRYVDYILCLTEPGQYFAAMADLVKPQGTICAVVESESPLPMNELRAKSVQFCWEGIFTRSIYSTPDMLEQHRLLNRVADLIDAGQLRTTVRDEPRVINAENLRNAHALIQTGQAIGKIVLSGFPT
jgi:zinc-binding alcohol dehydrogenase family protein